MSNGSLVMNGASVERDPRTGVPREVRGDFELPLADSAEDSVKSFLVAHADELSLPVTGDDLQTIKETVTPTGTVYRFRQQKDGIPIFGTEILVQLASSRRVRQLNLEHVSQPRVAMRRGDAAQLTPDAARKAADAAIGEHTLRRKVETPAVVYYPTDQGLKRAFVVQLLTDAPARDWRVIVDAYSGEILEKKDLTRYYEDGEGLVFEPNPVVTSGNASLRDPTATMVGCGFAGSPQATIDAQRLTRTLRQISKIGGKYRLEGPFVKVQNSPEELNKNNFKYQSSQDGFEAVMGYYHLDTLQRYIQDTLGITTAHNSQVDVVPHANQSYASYSPGDDTIRLGDSGSCKPDRGEDAEAMIHEYGHGIQSDMVPGWGDYPNPTTMRYETGAMGEGFGDILACAYFAPDHPFQREVFEDWCFADEGGMRRVDGTKTYPWNIAVGAGGDWLDDVHADGEIWSAALWNIFLDIGGATPTNVANCRAARDELLKTLILSHTRVPANGTMPKGAEAFMDENHDLPEYRLRNGLPIIDNFHERGLLHCTTGSNLKIESLWSQQNELPETGWQQVEFGQDNWFYARVRNTGTSVARAFVVTFSFKSPFATPVYPADFRDHIISAAVGYNLAPGATMTVRARWPKELIPPIPTGATERHGCLFAEVYNPVDHITAGVTTIGASNGKLAQCNTNIVDLLPDETIDYFFMVSNPHILKEMVVRLEIIRPPRWQNMEVSLHHRDPRVIKALWQQMQHIEVEPVISGGELVRPPTEVHVLEPTRVAVNVPEQPQLVMNLARGSSLVMPDQPAHNGGEQRLLNEEFTRRDVELRDEGNQPYLKLNPGLRVGLPYVMKPRERLTLQFRIRAPKDARPGEQMKFEVTQRNAQGVFVGGFDVRINIVAQH